MPLMINSQNLGLSKIKFYENETEIKNALMGGLNSPQFNSIDLNRDGINDILIFDRVGNVIIPMINKDNTPGIIDYEYDPSYKLIFGDLQDWVRIRDLNGDEIPDVFSAGDIPGIELRLGSIEQGELQFTKRVFGQGDQDVIYYQLNNGSWTQIFVANSDIPEIIDVDKDGDLDILSFEPNGGSFVRFWSNQAVEFGVSLDSFYFENVDPCFGKFKESGVSQDIFLSDDPESCASGLWDNGAEVRHDGSTLTALDKNGDGLWDVLIGDLTSPNLVYLQNAGTLENSWMNEIDDNFPRADVPVDLNIFNAGFYLDIDNDGKNDVVVSPNYRTGSAENYNGVWYYKDLSDSEEAEFVLQQDDLFVDQTIDLGSGSNPSFVDYNADGLIDIVVGSTGFYDPLGTKEARLYLFENVGDEFNPEYDLVDRDYLDFSQFVSTSNNYAPAFGDLDGDDDLDLLVGDNKGKLYFLENIAGPGQVFEFNSAVYEYMDIDVGENSKPQILDLNDDGFNDIIIGERNGNLGPNDLNYAINYFQNIGTEEEPMFDSDPTNAPNIATLGNVNTRDFGFSTPSTAPFLVYLPEEEDYVLFCGSESGRIKVYRNIVDNLDGTFEEIDNAYGLLWEGKRTVLSVADIDSDGYLEMVIGNDRGGITLYDTPIIIDKSLPIEELTDNDLEISIYPNPTKNKITVETQIKGAFKGRIMDKLGMTVAIFEVGNGNSTIDVSHLPDSMYFLELYNEDNRTIRKFVKLD